MTMLDPIPRDSLEATWSLPGWWKGALATREAVGDHEGASRIESILDGIEAGTPLEDIPEFIRWLAYTPARLHV